MGATQSDIRKVRFSNPRLARLGVEVISLHELRKRADMELLAAPQRVDFHHLLLVQAGRSRHMVDFVEHPLQPGAVLLVCAGQVQQWHLTHSLRGQLILISPEALIPVQSMPSVDQELLALDQWPSIAIPAEECVRQAAASARRLRIEIDRFTGSQLDVAIIKHATLAMLLRLARVLRSPADPADATHAGKIYRLFCRELEARFRMRPSVLDLARRIGFSESSLSRACVAVAGCTAKQAIDQRIALEAKRELVHSTTSIVEIGHRLGFSEPTNFVKFFRRSVQATPAAFRAGTVQSVVKSQYA